MRLIDADALLNREVYYDRAECLVLRYEIEKAPTIDAVPVVHGRWYWAEDRHCKCSVCGQYATVKRLVVKTNYCPNCGAKMDLED